MTSENFNFSCSGGSGNSYCFGLCGFSKGLGVLGFKSEMVKLDDFKGGEGGHDSYRPIFLGGVREVSFS